MKKVIERIVESPGAPNENDLWLNGKTLKKFQNGEWVAISGGEGSGGGDGSGSASSLSDMTDVDISSPSDEDTLVYNASTGKWENGSGGGSFEQVQADWEQADIAAADYIKNKPTIPVALLVVKGSLWKDGDDYFFFPDDNQPTFSEAVAAFNSGVQIIFDVDPNPDLPLPDGAYFRSTVMECVSDYAGIKSFVFYSGGVPVFWEDTDKGGDDPAFG